jgi:hypothetical protein
LSKDGPELTCWFSHYGRHRPHSGRFHPAESRAKSPANVTPARPVGERAGKIAASGAHAGADMMSILDESGHAGYGHPEVS